MNDYQLSLEAAGAEIHCFGEFGSYQGDWWAKITYEGKTGWITGSYGSCSGCDSFQCEFSYGDEENPDYQSRLAQFGTGYLDDIMTNEQAISKASENLKWDAEAQEMVDYIKAHV